jgi:UDP-N-acetylmuramoylalanine--D-glutamate ligase
VTTFADLAGRRVGVWGVGVEGSATLRRLAADGIEAAVVVESGWSPDLLDCDVVVKSPGISRRLPEAEALVAAGVELAGGLGLWLAGADRSRVLCVTGTKGKSTTTSIAGQLARGLGASVGVGGNLGSAPWDPQTPAADWWVIETSSYQATDIVLGPRVVAVTSLAQDHLTWHGGYDAYVRDKLSLATRPGVETVVIPAGDPELEAHAALLGGHVRRVPSEHPAWVGRLGLLGEHNRRNALIARAALVALGVPGAEDDDAIAAATAGFEPLPSRLTLVATRGGVDFVDDGLSTNVLAALAALDAFPGRRVALLVGGHDRGIDYTELGRGLASRDADVHLFTMPAAGARIAAEVASVAPGVAITQCDDLPSAVQAGAAWAAPGGVVLLSPAAPSFGAYRDYRHRGEHFAELARGLGES